MEVPDITRFRTSGSLVAVMVLALTALSFIGFHAARAEAQRNVAEQEALALRAQWAELDPRRLDEFRIRAKALSDRRIFGPESRLLFVENVQQAAQRSNLTDLRYELLPRASLETRLPFQGGAPAEASAMKIGMRIRREGELSTFFRDLRHQTRGLFWARHCSLQRQGSGDTDSGWRVECELLWITVKSPDAV